LEIFNIFYGHSEYFAETWEILWPIWVNLVHFYGFWYHVCTKENLATLATRRVIEKPAEPADKNL
jgi:hypothetical protein